MLNTTKKICINCNNTFPIYNELQEKNNSDFCCGKCFIEYMKNKSDEQEIKEGKRKEILQEIFVHHNQPIQKYKIIIECKECDLRLNFDLAQIKNPTMISNAVCSICQKKADVIVEVIKS